MKRYSEPFLKYIHWYKLFFYICCFCPFAFDVWLLQQRVPLAGTSRKNKGASMTCESPPSSISECNRVIANGLVGVRGWLGLLLKPTRQQAQHLLEMVKWAPVWARSRWCIIPAGSGLCSSLAQFPCSWSHQEHWTELHRARTSSRECSLGQQTQRHPKLGRRHQLTYFIEFVANKAKPQGGAEFLVYLV